jgi:hypothetical protein
MRAGPSDAKRPSTIEPSGTGAERKNDESLTLTDSGFVHRNIYAAWRLARLDPESFEAFGG